MDDLRFNPNHGAAGSGVGGQFVSAGGGGGKGGSKGGGNGGKPPAHTPAHGKATGRPAPKAPAHTQREQLLAEAKADRQRADKLETQLHTLEKQHAAAIAAAKKSAGNAAKARKAGHTVHHHKHTAAHHAHRKHAASLATRISRLRTEIHTLRQKAAHLEAQAKAARSQRDVSGLQFGHGSALWKYWTTGGGFAKWSGALHKWRTLRDLLLKAGVPAHSVDGLTTNIIMAVMPGYMKQAHKGRSAMDPDRAAGKPYGDVAYADPKNGKYPIDTKAHAQAAWSYINMPKNAAQYPMNGVTLSSVKARIMAACKKFGIMVSEGNSAPAEGEERTLPLPSPLDVTANGDGLTFEGYAAVYNRSARISAADGDFDEQILPGAFRAVAGGAYPKLMFEHGRHPLIGTMPLGRITSAREDDTGLWIEARLTDNWLVSPVRDAVAAGALDGMSFRFTVDDGGETWMDRSGDVPLRSLTSVSVPELGPVVFPAYQPTTAAVRSVLDRLPVIGRPAAGAVAASGRGGDAAEYAEPDPSLEDRFRADGEALALRGIRGVRIP